MDKEELVMEIRLSLNDYIRKYGTVNMAMLMKDINTDTYTFLIASKFLDLINPYDATLFVTKHFFENLSKEALGIISRINIVSTRDPSIGIIYNTMDVSNGKVFIKNCSFFQGEVFGVIIEDAILFESHRD